MSGQKFIQDRRQRVSGHQALLDCDDAPEWPR